MDDTERKDMIKLYVFETKQLIDRLEEILLISEENKSFNLYMDEMFRIVHTIKGNSAAMTFNNIELLTHQMEELFDYFRRFNFDNIDYSKVSDMIFKSIDFIKSEMEKLENGNESNGNCYDILDSIKNYLKHLHNNISAKHYKAVIFFKEDAGMENVRAFSIVHRLSEITKELTYEPWDIVENNSSAEIINEKGFFIDFKSKLEYEKVYEILNSSVFLKNLTLEIVLEDIQKNKGDKIKSDNKKLKHPKMLSVGVDKLDKLMNLVGELVIAESMVTTDPEIQKYQLHNFNKSARSLRKIIDNVQNVVMSIRMVPLSNVFKKMNRIVRDMSKKLDKDIKLQIIGEETEVDKNVIEVISDPLVHIIRNSIDHGIETRKERINNGKQQQGNITIEAENRGGDVYIIVKDDGRGMDKQKIYNKAKEHGILDRDISELSEKEIYSCIFLPGFTTKKKASEYSGRGVGMDIALRNIEKLRGTISVNSELGYGTEVCIRIPLTLAIIDGMIIEVGNTKYVIPVASINQCFKVDKQDVVVTPQRSEMILIRGKAYPVIRLHEMYSIDTNIIEFWDGIVIMVKNDDKNICLFADKLIGKQQVVVKAIPKYIDKIKGITGCTLMGDGSISLILDIQQMISEAELHR